MNSKTYYPGTLPQLLEQAVDRVNAEVIDYQGRDSDASQLSGYLAGGNHRMAEHVAGQMIERQRDIQSRLSASE